MSGWVRASDYSVLLANAVVRAVPNASGLGAQAGHSRDRQPHLLLNNAFKSVRAQRDLCRKSSKCIQCGEPIN